MLRQEDFRSILKETFDIMFQESTGITNRKEGDPFVNSDGDIITFQKIEEFTNEDIHDLVLQIEEWIESLGITSEEIKYNNKPDKSTNAARAAIFSDTNNNRKVFIRFFKSLASKWNSKQFAIDNDFKLNTKSGKGEHLPLKPTDIIKTEDKMSSSELYERVMANITETRVDEITKKEISDLITNFWNKTDEWTEISGDIEEKRNNYTKYLGEIVSPLAITSGFKVSGDYEKSEETLLGGLGIKYSDMLIHFPMSTSNELTDSILSFKGYEVNLSSKAKSGGGAAASAASLLHGVERLDDSFKKNHEQVVKLIYNVSKYSMETGVPYIGYDFGIITKEEMQYIIDRIKLNKKREPNKPIPEQFENLYKLTKKWTSEYKPNYKDGFHMHLAVGKEIAQIVNKSPEFDSVVRTILTNSSLIQVYCSMERKGNLLRFKNFNVKYPPIFVGKVELDASKNSSSELKSKIGFKFK
jgi:hypothetical protein